MWLPLRKRNVLCLLTGGSAAISATSNKLPREEAHLNCQHAGDGEPLFCKKKFSKLAFQISNPLKCCESLFSIQELLHLCYSDQIMQ